MSNWIVTAEGVECGSFVVPLDRLTKIRKGRYVAIKEICSRFFGHENDVGFISAWREALQRACIDIDEVAFRVTVKDASRMKAHHFVYAVCRDTLDPYADQMTKAEYFTRRLDPRDPDIERRTRAILTTGTRPKAGQEEHHDSIWQPDASWPNSGALSTA